MSGPLTIKTLLAACLHLPSSLALRLKAVKAIGKRFSSVNSHSCSSVKVLHLHTTTLGWCTACLTCQHINVPAIFLRYTQHMLQVRLASDASVLLFMSSCSAKSLHGKVSCSLLCSGNREQLCNLYQRET